jgi:hypothetical protein
MNFDFKSYHLRGIHAETIEEKQKINQELKDFYNSLTEQDKRLFNLELQKFLATEMGRLGSDYQAIKNQVSTD